MVCSLPGLAGVHAVKLVEEANKGEQDHVITLDRANVEHLALVALKRLPTVTRIPAQVRTYLFLTEFENRTVSYGPRSFPIDL